MLCMTFIAREEPFICEHCGEPVAPILRGTYRNHCPRCLWSKHVDDEGPGDRASACCGMMRPSSLDRRGKKGWVVIHECEKCGKTMPNKLSDDDQWERILQFT